VDLREFENARNIAQILQNSTNKVYLDSNGLGLNVTQTQSDKEKRAKA
jgi:prohibitin 2